MSQVLVNIKTTLIEVDSPCVRNCCLNTEDICLGCFRHIDEILVWGSATDDEKRNILQAVEQRKSTIVI